MTSPPWIHRHSCNSKRQISFDAWSWIRCQRCLRESELPFSNYHWTKYERQINISPANCIVEYHGSDRFLVFSAPIRIADESVPAEFASFPILTQLFTRISVDDGIEINSSTFSSEMREMAFILQNVSRTSLVLVDELGRGTSATDGLAIALAICGALVESRVNSNLSPGWQKATVLFATHFKEIANAFDGRPGFVNLHLHTEVPVHLLAFYLMESVGEKRTCHCYELSTKRWRCWEWSLRFVFIRECFIGSQ